jgi:hypothetical protein
MTKKLLFIGGALIILLLIAVWGYLFLFGTPESNDEIFANLGLSGEVDDTFVPPPVVVEEEVPVVNMERPKLRQLTTKPVAGFKEVTISTTTPPVLYYVEQGTGHVYTINTESGEEVRISGTTIAQAERAVISQNGRYAAITSASQTKGKTLFVGAFSTSTGALNELARETVQDFTLTNTEVLFTSITTNGLTGTAIRLATGAESTIFSAPFSEARVLWGDASNDVHYLYPKATYAFEGFLYATKEGDFGRLPISGFGLTANANDDIIVFSRSEKQVTKSYIYNLTTRTTAPLDAPVLPEKCTLAEAGLEFVCPFEAVRLPYEFPDEWYKGSLSFKDSLWLLSAETMTGEMLVDTFAASNREIDITNMQVAERGGILYFTNKNDNTLWMYEI